MPPNWIYNFDDSRLNIKTLTLDINKSTKKENNNQFKEKLFPKISITENMTHNFKIKTEDDDSFKNKYQN